ncbi:MAG: hypothetical protein PVG75_02525, partial [Thioalkalispiraceae bacterium]
KRPFVLLGHPRFRAAYDFLLLRCQSCEPELEPLCDWWTEFQEVSDQQRKTMCQELQRARQGQKPRRKKKGKARQTQSADVRAETKQDSTRNS